MINHEIVVQLFEGLRAAGIGPQQTLKWSYLFSDKETDDRLKLLVPKLEKDGYHFVSIYMSERSGESQVLEGRTSENPPLYVLLVEKEECHTITSFTARYSELTQLAEDNDVFSYDGMSVGYNVFPQSRIGFCLRGGQMISHEMVVEIFDQLRAAGIDPQQNLKWNYFFNDEETDDRLKLMVPKLEKDGYRFVSIYMSDPGGEPQELEGRMYGNPPLYVLQVEKEERHTITSLDARNSQLSQFAEDNDVFSYDGMSVGTLTGAPFRAQLPQRDV